MLNLLIGFIAGFAAAYFRTQITDAAKALYQKLRKKEPELGGEVKSGGGPGERDK